MSASKQYSSASLHITSALDRRGLREELRELWLYRSLIPVLARRELKLRYKNSIIGVGWSLSSPLIQVLVLTLAIHNILGTGPRNMSAFIFCAYVPWTFFQTGILDSSMSVLHQLDLSKKVYFPREIPVIAAVAANFVHFLISLGVFIVYHWVVTPIFLGWPGLPPWQIVFLPVVIAIEFMLILGISFYVSAWNVFYEDVKFMLTMVLSFLFYLLPIIYVTEQLRYSDKIPVALRAPLYHAYLAMPLAWVITAFRQVFFRPQNVGPIPGHAYVPLAPFDIRFMVIAAVLSVAICLGGYRTFNSLKWRFTERP